MRIAALLAVMPLFAWAELWQIGHKMAYKQYFSTSLNKRLEDFPDLKLLCGVDIDA